MAVRYYCDICDDQLPGAPKRLVRLEYRIEQKRKRLWNKDLHKDTCDECYESIKNSIANYEKRIREERRRNNDPMQQVL